MMNPVPVNPIDILVRLLLLLLLLFLGVSTVVRGPEQAIPAPAAGAEPGQGGGSSGIVTPTVIEKVETLVLESNPYQISLNVSGYQQDGCDLPVIVEQRREGNTVFVNIYREVPADMFCSMQLVPYTGTIKLDGGFESGAYQINVNGTIVDLQL